MTDSPNPFAKLLARQIMHADPICTSPAETLRDLRQRLVSSHVTGMPVVDHGRLVGVVSRSDIARVENLLESLDSEVAAELSWQDQQADGFAHAANPPAGGASPAGDVTSFRRRLDRMLVKDAMRTQVITCRPDDTAPQVARQMLEHHVHRIIVVEGQTPIGVISALDLARLVAGA